MYTMLVNINNDVKYVLTTTDQMTVDVWPHELNLTERQMTVVARRRRYTVGEVEIGWRSKVIRGRYTTTVRPHLVQVTYSIQYTDIYTTQRQLPRYSIHERWSTNTCKTHATNGRHQRSVLAPTLNAVNDLPVGHRGSNIQLYGDDLLWNTSTGFYWTRVYPHSKVQTWENCHCWHLWPLVSIGYTTSMQIKNSQNTFLEWETVRWLLFRLTCWDEDTVASSQCTPGPRHLSDVGVLEHVDTIHVQFRPPCTNERRLTQLYTTLYCTALRDGITNGF